MKIDTISQLLARLEVRHILSRYFHALTGFWVAPEETAEIIGKILGKEVKAVPIPEDQWVEIAKNYNSPKNAESMAEMFAGFNSGHIKFETENQISGKITVEDFVREALK